MALEITSGAQHDPALYVIHGPEGIGKTTLAAQFPNPLFIDTEAGTKRLDVKRLKDKPSSLEHLRHILNEFRKDPMGYKTLVIDTADWLQDDVFIPDALAKTGLAAMGWTRDENAYSVMYEAWGKFLNALTDIRDAAGVHIVVVAHSQIRQRHVPEEMGAYDQYQLKLLKSAAAKLMEWAEYAFFVNIKTLVIKDGDGKHDPHKGTNGEHTIFTGKHPCWIAKCKTPLSSEIPFRAGEMPQELRELISKQTAAATPAPTQQAATPAQQQQAPARQQAPPAQAAPAQQQAPPQPSDRLEIRKLRDLMAATEVADSELQAEMAAKGYFPVNTKIDDLPREFVEQKLIPNWSLVVAGIKGETANAAA